jgi:hypothetical protein
MKFPVQIKFLLRVIEYWAIFTGRTFLTNFYPPVVVYSCPKTGTSSIKVTLRKQLPNPVYHSHHFSPDVLRAMWQQNPDAHKDQWLADLIRHQREKKRWKVITLTREPVARTISNYFEGLENAYFAIGKRAMMDEMKDFLYEQASDLSNSMFTNPDFWFDEELKTVFGFDIYAEPFDPAKGYAIYKAEQADILLIRLEDLSRVGAQVLGEFLGKENIVLLKSNERALTILNDEYRQIQQTLKFAPEFLDALYAGRYVRHFYSAAEIETFKRRWEEK